MEGARIKLLKVWFSNVEDSLITNHEKLDFSKAVELTNELEMKYRKQKNKISSEFTVIDEKTNKGLYTGVFNFGSYDYPNIYHQIKDRANKIRVDKKSESDKNFLLEKIEELTTEEMKVKENIDKTLINIDKENVSKLKKWQRRTIYTMTGVLSFILIMVTVWSFTQMANYEKALSDGREQLNNSEKLVEEYETALQGNKESLIEHLLTLDNLTKKQEVLIVNYYVDKGEYGKAVNVLDDDSRTETMILMNQNYDRPTKINKIKEFSEEYSTNEARFDLAYFDKDYELMLNIKGVDMVTERSKMKTLAHLRLGQLDEAKIELKNNNDESVQEKLEKYEALVTEIDTLKEKIDKESNEKEENKLKETLKQKEEEKNKL